MIFYSYFSGIVTIIFFEQHYFIGKDNFFEQHYFIGKEFPNQLNFICYTQKINNKIFNYLCLLHALACLYSLLLEYSFLKLINLKFIILIKVIFNIKKISFCLFNFLSSSSSLWLSYYWIFNHSKCHRFLLLPKIVLDLTRDGWQKSKVGIENKKF